MLTVMDVDENGSQVERIIEVDMNEEASINEQTDKQTKDRVIESNQNVSQIIGTDLY